MELEEAIKVLNEWNNCEQIVIEDNKQKHEFDIVYIERKLAMDTVLSELANKNKIINDASTYLEYYLIDNLKYEDSQEEFKKLLKMLNKGIKEE